MSLGREIVEVVSVGAVEAPVQSSARAGRRSALYLYLRRDLFKSITAHLRDRVSLKK